MTTRAPAIREPVTTAPVEYVDLTGLPSDVLYAIGRYQEAGVLTRVERRTATHPGHEAARVYLTPGAPPVDVDIPDGRERWEIGDYFIASLTVLRYLLFAGFGAVVLWIGYKIVMAFVYFADWIGANGAAIASSLGGVLVLAVLVMLLSLLQGSKRCLGLHCSGCGKR